MNAWSDFNNAEPQQSFDLIPKGTVAPVTMKIRPGGYNDPSEGWTGGYATLGKTDAVFLDCEFVVSEGQFAKRKIWTLIGLHSPKGPTWANMGRSMVRAILNSARGISEKDESAEAKAKRCINGFEDLNGIEFLAKIDVEKGQPGYDDKNVIKEAVTPETKAWKAFYEAGGAWRPSGGPIAAAAAVGAVAQQAAANGSSRPPWAQQ